MLVLALDTTTPVGSCALASGSAVLREEASDPSREPASRLPGELMGILQRASATLADVDVFAVATGPGSFTGLRIGIATMQGLAFASGKPLVGISGLDALAQIGGSDGRVATWVDAWRGEVYAALYDRGTEIEPPVVARPSDLLGRAAEHPTLFIGDGAGVYREFIESRLGGRAHLAHPVAPRLAGTIARLAAGAVANGTPWAAHDVQPLYVRRTDAERARDARARG
jgi:tRNA threonylcarbamoyladenosine biosynthesis protein TsaB